MLKKYFIASSLFIAHTGSLHTSAPQTAKLVKNHTFNIIAFGVSTTMGARAEHLKHTRSNKDFTSYHTTAKDLVNSTSKK